MTGQGQQLFGVPGGVADAVHQQVGAVAEHGPQLLLIATAGGGEPAARRGDIGGHPGRVTPGQLD